MQPIQCAALGDKAVGKTCLLLRYAYDDLPSEYDSTGFDCYDGIVKHNEELYLVSLHDVTGDENYQTLLPWTYAEVDVVLLCFSVVTPSSFQNVKQKWLPHIQNNCPKTPFLLVGTKIDLRNDSNMLETLAENNEKPITTEQGKELAQEIKAVKYVECSAVTREGLWNVFNEAFLTALGSQ
ncbi:cdc42 homolog isoform X2 [Cephus cinctus]|uniref:Cdc42 homolog isoform X2 n=1 Tax=Cephus cinctus TaxID=211228 RepID=A0AAJ7FJ79_CEPCN|nr:cdc42 homolog isoform X2 [Cephus cinctus]